MPKAMRRDVYQETMRGINDELNKCSLDIQGEMRGSVLFVLRPDAQDAAKRDLGNAMRKVALHYAQNPPAQMPSRGELLRFLHDYSTNNDLKYAIERIIDRLEGRAAPPAPIEAVPVPRHEAEIRIEPVARPERRRPRAPTISELREQGYGNIIDAEIGGKIYRFAAKDPSLDLVGIGASSLFEYALSHAGEMRVFEVNRRGYATRELSRAALERIRAP